MKNKKQNINQANNNNNDNKDIRFLSIYNYFLTKKYFGNQLNTLFMNNHRYQT